MPAKLSTFVQFSIFTKWSRKLLRRSAIFENTMQVTLCNRCIRYINHTTSRYNGEQRSIDKPQKRKILRKIKADIVSKNASDINMEKAARLRKLLLPLEEVREGWTVKEYPHQVATMASYLGIFDHMFDGRNFKPAVVMNVEYEDGTSVHYGNFLETARTSCEPQVSVSPKRDSLSTLLMVNLDGNIYSRDNELLHWMVGNIPEGDLTKGDVISQYLPPCPAKGTGFHRFVFCLLNQETHSDFEELYKTHNARSLASRSFRTSAFLKKFQFDPVGLSFFQATWDDSVSNVFTEVLGIKEPVYGLEPFLTPNQKKRQQVRKVFAKKYTNM